MKTMLDETTPARMDEEFIKEYSSDAAVRKYTKKTAGNGISYLLEHEYGKIYLDALRKVIAKGVPQEGVRLLEFGCGGGMNLVHLVSLVERNGIRLQNAYGTDFSPTLIDAANREAKSYLSAGQNEKVRFVVARNENLVDDLKTGLGADKQSLTGTFHLIVGVNTFRYCERLKKGVECATAISNLLVDGGICVMIDMNQNFPAFRSRFRDRMTKEKEAYYLPTLDEYSHPFSTAGFKILEKKNFCWIPHSAGPMLTGFFRAMTPILDATVISRAMRSLVIAQKRE